jgi:hypothetical protein
MQSRGSQRLGNEAHAQKSAVKMLNVSLHDDYNDRDYRHPIVLIILLSDFYTLEPVEPKLSNP